jgi:hypothetical protein
MLADKEMSGDTRALAARLQYQEFVATQSRPPEIIIEHASQRFPETSTEK